MKVVSAVCGTCRKRHQSTQDQVNTFGADLDCVKCLDAMHDDFMRKHAASQNLSCVAGCRCGFGPGSRHRND